MMKPSLEEIWTYLEELAEDAARMNLVWGRRWWDIDVGGLEPHFAPGADTSEGHAPQRHV